MLRQNTSSPYMLVSFVEDTVPPEMPFGLTVTHANTNASRLRISYTNIHTVHTVPMNSVHPNYDYADEIESKMLKDGSNWRCLVCNHSSNRKSSVYYHVEAKHTASSGFSCHVCSKFCPTTNALRTHLSRQHKNM